MSDFMDGELRYEVLEREAKKKEDRRQLELLMLDYSRRGGVIRQVYIASEPKPVFKHIKRKKP